MILIVWSWFRQSVQCMLCSIIRNSYFKNESDTKKCFWSFSIWDHLKNCKIFQDWIHHIFFGKIFQFVNEIYHIFTHFTPIQPVYISTVWVTWILDHLIRFFHIFKIFFIFFDFFPKILFKLFFVVVPFGSNGISCPRLIQIFMTKKGKKKGSFD